MGASTVFNTLRSGYEEQGFSFYFQRTCTVLGDTLRQVHGFDANIDVRLQSGYGAVARGTIEKNGQISRFTLTGGDAVSGVVPRPGMMAFVLQIEGASGPHNRHVFFGRTGHNATDREPVHIAQNCTRILTDSFSNQVRRTHQAPYTRALAV